MKLAFSTRLPRIGSLAALVLVGAVIAAPQLASAGVITFTAPTITITPAQAAAGVTGYANVTISEPGGGDTIYQSGVDLFLDPKTSGLNFVPYAGDGSVTGQTAGADYHTEIGPPALETYLFNGKSSDISFNSPVFTDSYDGSNANQSEAQTSDETTGTGVALSASLLGLMRIEYNIPAGSPAGTYPLTFTPAVNGGGGNFTDNVSVLDSNYQLPGSLVNGAIIIQTPEPSSMLMMVLGTVGLIGLGVRRTRRA